MEFWEDIIVNGGVGTVIFECDDGPLFGVEGIIAKRNKFLSSAFAGSFTEIGTGKIKITKPMAIVKKVLLYLHILKFERSDIETSFQIMDLARTWEMNDLIVIIEEEILKTNQLSDCLKAIIYAEKYKFYNLSDKLLPIVCRAMVNHIPIDNSYIRFIFRLPSELKMKILLFIVQNKFNTVDQPEPILSSPKRIRPNGG